MAGFPVDPVIEKLIKACYDYLQDQVEWQTGMKTELRRLQENLIKIKAVVADSSQAQNSDQNSALNDWIWKVRDAIDEADDLLDDFEYMKHKEQLIRRNMVETKNLPDATKFLLEGTRKVGRRALKIDHNLKRLKEVVQKLDEVSTDFGTFLHLVKNIKQEQQEQQLKLFNSRETGCLPKNDLVGRGKYVKSVMKWLRKASNEDPTHITGSTSYKNISLLSIVGHGGMGKTTLLQHVYDDLKTEFELKMWVCVSNDFDPKKVIASMLEHCKKDSSESLAVLQRNLKSMVRDKKFLLVLDDIWEEEEKGQDISKWEIVLAPLISGSFGSKILVTTRMNSVASMMAKVIGKKKIKLSLKGMKEDDCLKLFNTHAFADEDNPEDYKKLRQMAREIVKKLSGSPLAAKVIGAALNYNLEETHWRSVLNNDIGSAALGPNNIMSILRLSYAFLSKPLQRCFAFCSIFPQDHKFDKNDLVRMWISLGFIQAPSTSNVTLEDIGGRYLNTLVKKSFFDMHESYNQIYYTVHDLMHELAQSISAHECFRFVGDKDISFIIPETTRHLFVDTGDLKVLRKIKNLKNLHSFFLSYCGGDQEFIYILRDIFRASKNIRLLSINSLSLAMLLEAIENLTHLRYLKFSYVTHLPKSLSSLYHLQFIIIEKFSEDKVILPRGMNNLTNLCYLKMPLWRLFFGIPEIGKLNSLQELDGFYIKNKNGFRIGELEHMNSLRLLNINSLENIRDAKEVCSAKLCEKSYLMDLSLNWSDGNILSKRETVDPNLDEKVLENLQPPNNLKKLSIISYMGSKSASWMDNAELISNLEKIELNDCLEWETLPPFEQLPFLKSLYLDNMPKVKRFIDKFCVFPSLEWLRIRKLEALEDWFDAVGAPEDECLFPCLTELYLEDCPNLPELPALSPKLEKLEIYRVGCKALKWKQGISNCCSISISIPLETLSVIRCPNLTSIPLADETVRLEALRYLTIRDCANLNSLGGLQDVETSENFKLILSDLNISHPSVLLMEPLRSIAPIKQLKIMRNDELVSFPIEAQQWFLQDRPSLRELRIEDLKSLQSLPSSLESLSSLENLELLDLPQLQLLPNIPASLKGLSLHRLQSLQYLPSFLSTLHNSSLKFLSLWEIPLLKSLPDLPRSLCNLYIYDLDKIDCLPSSIASLSSLQNLRISNVPQLRELPDLPRSLCKLDIEDLDKIDCLPSSIASLSSLRDLSIIKAPQLRELPDLPRPLCNLYIDNLDKIDCLPSSIASLSSLLYLRICNVPKLRELPDLPPSLKYLSVINCHPKLKKRYKKPSGSDLQKFAHIPDLVISVNNSTQFINYYAPCNALNIIFVSAVRLGDGDVDEQGLPFNKALPAWNLHL